MAARALRNVSASVYGGSLGLEPYPKYKDVGVQWLSELPAHWEARRLGAVGPITKCSGGTKADEVPEGIPCVRYGDLYTHHGSAITESRSFVSPERADAYSRIKYGDLLFAASGETIDEIGKSSVNLMEGEAVCGGDVILLRPTIPVDARFLAYAANAPYMTHQKSRFGRGMTVMHIYGKQLKDAVMFLPPLPEQRAIADFIARETGRIDALVRKQERLIDLLREKRTALISHVVTRGLDANVPMKDSGVEWLGEIPAHWEVRRVKECAGVRLSNVDKKVVAGEPRVRLCNYTDVYYEERIHAQLDFMRATAGAEQVRSYSLKQGDVLITKDSETWMDIAVPAVVEGDLSDVLCGYHLALLRPRPQCLGAFLALTIAAAGLRDQYRVAANGVTRFGLTRDSIGNGILPLPPLAEQRAITDFIDRETARTDALMARIGDAMERLREYRTALISSAVTGKIDVRSRAVSEGAGASTGEAEA